MIGAATNDIKRFFSLLVAVAATADALSETTADVVLAAGGRARAAVVLTTGLVRFNVSRNEKGKSKPFGSASGYPWFIPDYWYFIQGE